MRTRVIAFEVGDIEAGIVWPEINWRKMDLTKRCATSPYDDTWAFGQGRVVEPVLTSGTHNGNATDAALRFSEVMAPLESHEFAQRCVAPFTGHNPSPPD